MDRKELVQFFQTEHIDEIFAGAVVKKDGISLPLEVEISLVDACTRHCEFCPRNDDSIAPHTSLKMTSKLYKGIARELRDIGFKVLLMVSGYGECLLHDNVVDFVREFNFTKVDITTNGDLLTREKIQELKDAGVYKILISVYEPDKMDNFRKLAKGYEDIIIIRNRFEHFDRLYNNRAGVLYTDKKGGVCFYPFYIMMIDSNGDIFPCCHEWQRRLKMGNLYQKSLWDIWTSKDYKIVRDDLAEGKRSLFPCRICNVDGTLRGEQNIEPHIKRRV